MRRPYRKRPYPAEAPVFAFKHCSTGDKADVVFVGFTRDSPTACDSEFPLRVLDVGDNTPEHTGIVRLDEVTPLNDLAEEILELAKLND